MAFVKRTFEILLLGLICLSAQAEKVTCPENLNWSFSHMQCAKVAGKQEASCPAPSSLSKPSVLGPSLCVSRGKCLGGGEPNAVGACIEPQAKLVKTYPFTKITHL